MMKKFKKQFILWMSIVAAALCNLPIMSTCLNDGEQHMIVIQGYNLMEFSALGCIPVFAVLLIPVILFGSQTKAAKEVELILLFCVNMVCYVHSFTAARAWLDSIGDSLIIYYPGRLLYPAGFLAVLILSAISKRNSVKKYYGVTKGPKVNDA